MRLASAIFRDFHPFCEFGLFNDYTVVKRSDDLQQDDVLVVWGGEDISPRLYGKTPGQYMYADQISVRDHIEWSLMQRAEALNIPIIGVCRGAQMLCAKAGGKLIQHVNNHGGRRHAIDVEFDGQPVLVNSLHHQMMYPFDVEHQLIAASKEVLSDVHYDVNDDIHVPKEPEFVYFPKIKGIAVQWHPEMMHEKDHANLYFSDWLKKYFNKGQ